MTKVAHVGQLVVLTTSLHPGFPNPTFSRKGGGLNSGSLFVGEGRDGSGKWPG